MPQYFWQSSEWPRYRWNAQVLLQPLAALRKLQGRLLGVLSDLGFDGGLRACATAVEEDAIQTAAIEGETLDREGVRSSIALHLLLDAGKGGFKGGLTTRKYMGLAKISRATAWREIEDLLQKGLLQALPGSGRSSAYDIAWEDEKSYTPKDT